MRVLWTNIRPKVGGKRPGGFSAEGLKSRRLSVDRVWPKDEPAIAGVVLSARDVRQRFKPEIPIPTTTGPRVRASETFVRQAASETHHDITHHDTGMND